MGLPDIYYRCGLGTTHAQEDAHALVEIYLAEGAGFGKIMRELRNEFGMPGIRLAIDLALKCLEVLHLRGNANAKACVRSWCASTGHKLPPLWAPSDDFTGDDE